MQVRVHNVGERAGREIVQIYLGCEADLTGRGDPGDPPRLVGFDEVLAAPDEIATATVVIPRRVLARWDSEGRWWRIAGGTRRIIAAQFAGKFGLCFGEQRAPEFHRSKAKQTLGRSAATRAHLTGSGLRRMT